MKKPPPMQGSREINKITIVTPNQLRGLRVVGQTRSRRNVAYSSKTTAFVFVSSALIIGHAGQREIWRFSAGSVGVTSALFIRSVYGIEDFSDQRVKESCYRHLFGMLLVGIIIYGLMEIFGHYSVQGVGCATVQDILMGTNLPLYLLVLLFALKLLATSVTLGSGASGGVFSPLLFLGATSALYGSFFAEDAKIRVRKRMGFGVVARHFSPFRA